MWVRVDDGLVTSRKVLAIPRDVRMATIGLWTLCCTWSARELSDGRIPQYLPEELGGTLAQADELVRVGLWHAPDTTCDHVDCGEASPDEYVIHDWADYQPSGAQATAKRADIAAKRSAAGKKGADSRWGADGKNDKPLANAETAMANDDTAIATAKQDDSPVPVPVPVPVPNPSSIEEGIYPDVEYLCTLLSDLIEGNGSKRPKVSDAWRTAARRLLVNDGRDIVAAEYIMRWCQEDQFWQSNIMSMPTFRKKYDQLRLQADVPLPEYDVDPETVRKAEVRYLELEASNVPY